MALSNGEIGASNFYSCNCKSGELCTMCTVPSGSDRANLEGSVSNLLGKIHTLMSEVSKLSKFIKVQNDRIQKLEGKSVVTNGSCEESVSVSRRRKSKNRKRKVRKEMSKNISDSEVSFQGENDSVLSSRLSYSAVSKNKCQNNKQAYLSSVNCFYSEESDSESYKPGASGSESGDGKRRKRKRRVKSGAKVKLRPVVKTELWPHIIVNEEEGEDVTSKDIGLAKFLSCFTHIMVTSCQEAEAAGRAVLLHAVSTILEYLPWTEARSFHNLVMVKIEQDRINWSTDFLAMADQFLLRKVRMNLRARSSSAGNGHYNSFRNNNYGVKYGNSNIRNCDSNYNKNDNHKFNSQPLYSFLCKQWNAGACSYGVKCKRWHTCWSCAEMGKLGEPHKACSHDSAADRSKEDNWYV